MKIAPLMTLGLAELRQRFLVHEEPLPPGLLDALQADHRRGARDLARRIVARKNERRAEDQRLHRLLNFERALWAQGFTHIAGVDEAGVAPLAGPVVAAACILPHDFRPLGIDDSKKLDPNERATLEAQIKQSALAWSVGLADAAEIDSLNIFHASLLAMRRAVVGLHLEPDHLLVDARTVPGVTTPQRGLIHGDALCLTIAAASILAKTARDRLLGQLDQRYPGYGFAKHKGYPTPEHFAALRRLGACPVHRQSFAPVREVLGRTPPSGSADQKGCTP